MKYFISESILEKYKDKKLEEIFPNSQIINTKYGNFLKINNIFECNKNHVIKKDELELFKIIFQYDLKVIDGVGSKTEKNLRKKRINTLYDLNGISPKKYFKINEIIRIIDNCNFEFFNNFQKIKVEYLIPFFNLTDFLFLDIETTGLTNSETFLIGLGYFDSENNFKTEILFAREIAEEIAIIYHFFNFIQNFKVFISFNGKFFDIPFLMNRISILLEEEDLEIIYKNFMRNNRIKLDNNSNNKTKEYMLSCIFNSFLHVDLLPICKRLFKNSFKSLTLQNLEQNLINFYREENIPSYEIPQVYLDWLNEPAKYMGGIYKIIEHNYYDIANLQALLRKIIDTSIINTYKKINV